MIGRLFILLYLLVPSNSFLVPISTRGFLQPSFYTSRDNDNISRLKCANNEPKVIDNVLQDIHDSGYTFRIVVIGNGAILETTSPLGPIKKSSTSPKTGERLVTLASEDKSFEFHVKVDQVKKIVFAETKKTLDGGEKILRICRFMNESGVSICSLIMADGSEESSTWFSELKTKYTEHSEIETIG